MLQNSKNTRVQVFPRKKPHTGGKGLFGVWLVGWLGCCFFLQSFFPLTLEVEVFYCRNEYFWIDLLMSSSLIFMDPLRIDTQCGLQRLPSAISLAIDHPYTCATHLPWQHLEVSSLQDYSHSLYINFQGKHLYRAGKMENMHPFRPHILTVHCHSLKYIPSSQNNSRLQKRIKTGQGGILTLMYLFFFHLPHSSTLHDKPAHKAYDWGRYLYFSPCYALLQAIHNCMALLGSEPCHASFWVEMGNDMTSVIHRGICKLVAKCFELLQGERCNRNLKQRRKILFYFSIMELPATFSLFKLTSLLLDR